MNEYEKAILDMYGYLIFSMRQGTPNSETYTTLVHDIAGLARNDECFSPRSNGYAKYIYMEEKHDRNTRSG